MGSGAGATLAQQLSLTDHIVLAIFDETPTHGFAVARVLEPQGAIGRIFHVPRPVVYRSIDHLVALGALEALGQEESDRGPRRTRLRCTLVGQHATEVWLATPVTHIRDIRTALLAKLAFLDRRGSDPGPLLSAQRDLIAPIVESLAPRTERGVGFEGALSSWRFETAMAALRFVEGRESLRPKEG